MVLAWFVTAALAQEPSPVIGAMERDVIDATVKAHMKPIRACYLAGLVADPLLSGLFVPQFTIGQDGAVVATEIKSSTLWDPVVERCILDELATLVFPTPKGGIVIVSYPFKFSNAVAGPLPRRERAAVAACLTGLEPREGTELMVGIRSVGTRVSEARVINAVDAPPATSECLLDVFAHRRGFLQGFVYTLYEAPSPEP